MRTALNRVLLGLTGLVLLMLGLAVLIGGLDLQRHWGFTMPSSWPFTGPDDVLLSADDRTRYRSHGWWWPVVIAVLGVIVLASLSWLLAQAARTRRLRQVRIDSGDGQGALLRGRALESVLTEEAAAHDGVEWANAALTGKRGAPQARLVLGLVPQSRPADVAAALDTSVLARARTSAGLDALPAEARLRAVKRRARRVS